LTDEHGPEWIVYHIDEDQKNNNLKVIDRKEDGKMSGKKSKKSKDFEHIPCVVIPELPRHKIWNSHRFLTGNIY